MKKLLLIAIAVGSVFVSSAQKVYFLYLQTDDRSPFYVRMYDKIYSSAASGFLILPNLTDSTYNLNIGFAKSTKPETRFAVSINQNDKGYLVKNFDDGLALFDMQNLTVLKSVTAATDNTIYETKTDKFSSILSKAADDPSLLKVPVTKKEEPVITKAEEKPVTKPKEEETPTVTEQKENTTVRVEPTEIKNDPPAEPKREDTVLATQTNEIKPAEKEDNSMVTGIVDYKPSVVTRRSESSTTEGFGIVYYDVYDARVDTIRILIPPSKIKFTENESLTNTDGKTNETTAVITENELAIEKGKDELKAPATLAPENCKSIASDKDFMKLRKNMAAKEDDEGMLELAKKMFKDKCFSVEQVRYLSTLFLSAAGKYQFFDAAFAHVKDPHNFTSLQGEIKDDYYLRRFKALIGE